MTAPAPQQPAPYPSYPVYPMRPEGFLTKRGVWVLNLFAAGAVWLGVMVFVFRATDAGVIQLARFLIVSGAGFGALVSAAGGLGSHKTSDMQNLGLLLLAAAWVLLLGQVIVKFA